MEMPSWMLIATGLVLVLAGFGFAWAQETYTVDGVALTEGELSAYQSTVATEMNRMRAFQERAKEALSFFDALDPGLFDAAEKAKIKEARTVIRLAAKRQIEALGAAPSTARDVKLRLLQRAVDESEGQARTDAQAALDAWVAANPE